MFKSLKTKLLVYFFIANFIVLSAFSYFIYSTAYDGVLKELDSKLKILSQDAIVDLSEEKNFEAKNIEKDLSKEFNISPLHVKILYYDESEDKIKNNYISSNNLDEIYSIPIDKKSQLNDIYYFDRKEFRVSSMYVYKKDNNKIFFQLAIKKVVSSSYLQELKLSLFIVVPIVLFLILYMMYLLMTNTLKPMKDVVLSAKNLSSNDLSARISSKNIPMEVQELVDTFNNLLKNIEDAFTRVSTFSADASHELKTPLTVMRGEIEVILKKDRDIDEYKRTLKSILSETIFVQDTISQLFLLSKKDTSELNVNVEDIYVDELLVDVVDLQQEFANKKNIKLIIDDLMPLSLSTNEVLLKIAISNILKNSILYSDEYKDIHISLIKKDEYYELKIIDNGYGISKEDLGFIFDRFYRVDKARNRQTSGTGLGLAIVKMILDIYGYDIKVNSELGFGTTTTIKLKMNKS